jgi:hypothetical protein
MVRSVACALYVIKCSALPVVITCGREISCKLTGKARRRRHHVEDQLVVNKCYRSPTFNSGTTSFAEKGNYGRETSEEKELRRDL